MTEGENGTENAITASLRAGLADAPANQRRILERVAFAALGSLPWVGGLLSVVGSVREDREQGRFDQLQNQWIEENERKLERLRSTLNEMAERFERLGPDIEARLASDEYLDIVRRSFRTWDKADTDEKRRYVANLITNAGGTRLCSDDVVRLFIDWLDTYHEAHFAVIRGIYQRPGTTRFHIWRTVWGEQPREDSAEADLYRLLIRDLSTGGVIRQERETTSRGEFLRQSPSRKRRSSTSAVHESAFEATKPYVLTALGEQFVHYTMNEVVARLATHGASRSGS